MLKHREKKARRREGPIGQSYSKKAKKKRWGFDVRVSDGRGGKRRMRIYQFESRKEAEEALAALRRSEREAKFGLAAPIKRPALKELIDLRTPGIELRAERTRATRVFRVWLDLLPAGIKIDEITTPLIRLYVERRQADGQAAASINRELNIIAAALNSVAEFFPELAQWRPPKIPRPKVSKSRRERIISDDEYRRLLDHLSRPADERDGTRVQDKANARRARLRVAAVLRFAMNSGMRPKEIFLLKWADVDYDNRRIRVRGTKTETKTPSTRYVPLTAPLIESVEEQREFATKRDYIFSRGGNPTPKHYRILREAAEAVGIEYGRDSAEGFVLYCARHTFTTKLLQSGLDLRTVGDITGHTDRELVLHYSHVTPESAARAVVAIEAVEAARLNGNGQKLANKNKTNCK